MTEFTSDDVQSLADKLEALVLSEGERVALAALIEAAAERAEVEGFGFRHEHQNPLGTRLGAILLFDEADSLFGKRSGAAGAHPLPD